MSIAVVSYSRTGNNSALAGAVARELAADHIQIAEPQPRGMGSILLDTIFNRSPKLRPGADVLAGYDRIIFMGPVWMGQAAAPLRRYLRFVKDHPRKYAYACLSGGGPNPNPNLAGDLEKRTGAQPAALVDLHICDLLRLDREPEMKDTMDYRLTDADKASLTEAIVKGLKEGMQ